MIAREASIYGSLGKADMPEPPNESMVPDIR
jgi:hypothetical protein